MERKRRGTRVEGVSPVAGLHRLHGDAPGRSPAARNMDVLPGAVAQALGTSRRAAEAALWGPLNLARRCARVIAALKAAGADEALVRFIQPIDLAIHGAQPTTVTDDGLLGASWVSCDVEPPAVPTREVAQAFLNKLYDELERRTAPVPVEARPGRTDGD